MMFSVLRGEALALKISINPLETFYLERARIIFFSSLRICCRIIPGKKNEREHLEIKTCLSDASDVGRNVGCCRADDDAVDDGGRSGAGEDAADESPRDGFSAASRSVWTERRSASTLASMSESVPASPSASASAMASRRPTRRSRRRPHRRNPRARRCSRAIRARRSAKNLPDVLSTQIIIDQAFLRASSVPALGKKGPYIIQYKYI